MKATEDSRVFRLTTWYGASHEYCNRRGASARCARGENRVTRVEATDAEATAGWTDVTIEFPRVVQRNQKLQQARDEYFQVVRNLADL